MDRDDLRQAVRAVITVVVGMGVEPEATRHRLAGNCSKQIVALTRMLDSEDAEAFVIMEFGLVVSEVVRQAALESGRSMTDAWAETARYFATGEAFRSQTELE